MANFADAIFPCEKTQHHWSYPLKHLSVHSIALLLASFDVELPSEHKIRAKLTEQ